MRHRKRLIIAALVFALAGALVVVNAPPTGAERDARALREEARRRGFKFDLAEFNRSLTPEKAALGRAISNAFGGVAVAVPEIRSMHPAARATANPQWPSGNDLDAVAGILAPHSAALDATRAALQNGGTFRFPLISLLPFQVSGRGDVSVLSNATRAFVARTSLSLREGDADGAWADLLAANALVTKFEPDGGTESAILRLRLAYHVFTATWETLHARSWTDAQLAGLERLWRDAGFSGGMDEVLMHRACELLQISADQRESYGREPLIARRLPALLRATPSNPKAAWKDLGALLRESAGVRNYVGRDSYLDDLNILRHFEDRLGVMRRALACENWRAMTRLPGVIGSAPLTVVTNGLSSPPSLCEVEMIELGWRLQPGGGLPSGYFTHCIEAEARRRVLLAAIAVERARLRLGHLPASLVEAGFVEDDYMTGEPLNYRPEPDGTYLVYSVGLDLVDDAGMTSGWTEPSPRYHDDIAWPRRVVEDGPP